MIAGPPKLLNIAFGNVCPKAFFVLRLFLSICGLVFKKYMGVVVKNEASI
jgi:hypothetical protein